MSTIIIHLPDKTGCASRKNKVNKMQFKQRTLMQIADMICGNFPADTSLFVYRSSSRLTEFFMDCDTDYEHDGSTRNYWVAETLRTILAEPQAGPNTPPDTFARVIETLMDQTDAQNEGHDRPGALAMLAASLVHARGSSRSMPTTKSATCATSQPTRLRQPQLTRTGPSRQLS
jgi:hypothetical protein